jgi:mRNA-degrading endonuclease RelE of RelBE toxin-antitoxin system
MAEVDVTTEEALLKVLDSLKRYGLAEPGKDGIWRFRTSAYRLLDILNMAGRALTPEPEQEAQ